jgi:hypothetical protein
MTPYAQGYYTFMKCAGLLDSAKSALGMEPERPGNVQAGIGAGLGVLGTGLAAKGMHDVGGLGANPAHLGGGNWIGVPDDAGFAKRLGRGAANMWNAGGINRVAPIAAGLGVLGTAGNLYNIAQNEKNSGFVSDIQHGLGMESKGDKARRSAMVGAAIPFAGTIGAIAGGAASGNAGGATGAAAGNLAGSLGGAAAGAGLGALGAGLLLAPKARRAAAAASKALQDKIQSKAHISEFDLDFDDMSMRFFNRNAPSPAEAGQAAADEMTSAGLLGGGGLGAYGGGIYGAGVGAEHGTDNW